jgi:hypothetical protein
MRRGSGFGLSDCLRHGTPPRGMPSWINATVMKPSADPAPQSLARTHDQAARCALALLMTWTISDAGQRLMPPILTGRGMVPSATRRQKVALEHPSMRDASVSLIKVSAWFAPIAPTPHRLRWGEHGRNKWDSGLHCPKKIWGTSGLSRPDFSIGVWRGSKPLFKNQFGRTPF